MTLRKTIAGLVAGLSMTLASGALADWAPKGPLKLQIGFAAGGSTDTMGRVIAKVMKDNTGWNVIAENKTGGGGLAMFTGISKMPARGTVIGMGVNMPILVNLNKRPEQVPFDLDSFDYLGTVARAQVALVARADAPFDDLAGMIDYSKANGGIAVSFDAAPQKLLMEVVNAKEAADFRFVSTKGEAEGQKLILGGQVMAGFSAGTHVKYLDSGDFKMIAVGNNSRHRYAPDTPTINDLGYDAYVDPYFYFATTAGTDPEAKAALAAALAEAIESDEVQQVVRNVASTDPLNLGAEATKAMMVDGLQNVGVLFGQ